MLFSYRFSIYILREMSWLKGNLLDDRTIGVRFPPERDVPFRHNIPTVQ
jgi:hypothetical protein